MTQRILERAKASRRTDDNPESLKKRFDTFERETLPVIEYYSKQNKVIKVIYF
jgi:UMP-CMP kinase